MSKVGREGRQQAEHHIDADPEQQDGLAPEPVRQGAVDQLGPAEAEQIGGDDPLAAVFVLHAQVFADVRQGRQHRVDGQGVQRHHQCDQTDELDEAGLLPGGR
jgi:hypothetical protein